MSLNQQQLEQFHREGYIIVPDVFDSDAMDAALKEVDLITYGKSFAEVLEDADKGILQDEKNAFSGEGNAGRAQFPTGIEALDRLFENEEYLDIFEQLLGDKPSYCNAHLFVRSGPTDKRHSEHPWEGYHTDHDTNCFLPPSSNVGPFDYVNSGAYLHDVEMDCAPMRVIPGSHLQLAGLIPRLIAEDNWNGRSGIKDIRKIPEFAEPVPTVATKGSASFYSSYLIHAAVPFDNKRVQRSFWTMSCCRRDTQGFVKYSNLYHPSDRKFSNPFFTNTTPRVRSIFGWPEPGNPYYTEETLRLIEAWFPGMDLTPYQCAVS
ncbi:MAG: phytanoyl-CoA dioxygenase family protein [Planctomycetota bacterium]|nr:phytanoyl-CoA dioxygenase family protein [Planctomycetota bacterium]MDA1141350.1 phytanoyl-CoA dioxygenase family protein [Planctomycetota bacterium]